MVAMCAFGMPFSNNFKVVNVSDALNATKRVNSTALSFITAGRRITLNACAYASRTLISSSLGRSFVAYTTTEDARKAYPQNFTKASSATPYEFIIL